MKRSLAFLLVVACVFALAGCSWLASISYVKRENAKESIFDLVEDNYDIIVTACRENPDALLDIGGVIEVKVVGDYVLAYCKGAGIAPSSQDYGFYYSTQNLPITVNCNLNIECLSDELTPEGDGYQYVSSDGNVFYTEHIRGNLYFYKNEY